MVLFCIKIHSNCLCFFISVFEKLNLNYSIGVASSPGKSMAGMFIIKLFVWASNFSVLI